MAEARSAVAISVTISHEGWHLHYDQELLYDIWISVLRSYKRRVGRFKNNFKAGIYPMSPVSLVFTICVITGLAMMKKDVSFGFGIIEWMQRRLFGHDQVSLFLCGLIYSCLLWFLVIQLIRYSIKCILLYKGWIYERTRKPSLSKMIYLGIVQTIFRQQPMLYSFQGALPRLPLPSIDETLRRHLKTMRPLLTDKQYERMDRLSEEFRSTIASKLQRYLILKSLFSSNYVTDWWEEYVYLRSRLPIMINSNYYGVDTLKLKPTHIQAARAANMVCAMLEFRRLIDRQELKPTMIFGVPVCSFQYERMFNTCRVPGVETDTLQHWRDSKHLAVYYNGCWWKLPIHNGRRLLKPSEVEVSFQCILDSTEKPYPGEERLGALTAGNRIPWANARLKYLQSGINKQSLDVIERSAFVVALEDESVEYDENDPSKINHWAEMMLHGKGYDRWFDKSFNFIVARNAKCGVNGEHSCFDAPIFSHLIEFSNFYDIGNLGYAKDGHCLGDVSSPPPVPVHLKWDIQPELMTVIDESHKTAKKLISDVDMNVIVFNRYGKGFIKTCKVSPDGYIQMALQLANYRDQGRFCLTYEASMTRLFREGRTETVRSATEQSCAFVRAMVDDDVTNEVKIGLLREACQRHQRTYLDSMCGKGVDRHLFALYVVSKYLELDSPFLTEVLSEPWRLSTSQTPHQQTDLVDLKKHPEFVSAGGGFGPVADDGYGVSYIVAGETTISFHISSKESCPTTSSLRFRQEVEKALLDMQSLFSD